METPEDSKYKLCVIENNGKKYHELAFYTKGKDVQFEDENEDYPELYNDEKETSFLSEGWYNECGYCERFNTVKVSEWGELPKLN